MEGTAPVFVICFGGTHDGHAMPWHPEMLQEGSPLIVSAHDLSGDDGCVGR
jgi:hypothetical protein